MLTDMPLYQYCRYMERVRKPTGVGSLAAFARRFGTFLLFDQHYELSTNYVQIRRKRPHRVRVVGPNCPRATVNNGEDSSLYNSLLFSTAHCCGEGDCRNPLNFRSCFFPRRDLASKGRMCSHKPACAESCVSCASTVLQSTCAPQWKVRVNHIFRSLAPRAEEKFKRAKRIPTLADTIVFKGWVERTSVPNPPPVQSRLLVDTLLLHLYELKHSILQSQCLQFDDFDRAIDCILEFVGLPTGHHEDQLSLAEFCAYESRRVLIHLLCALEIVSSWDPQQRRPGSVEQNKFRSAENT